MTVNNGSILLKHAQGNYLLAFVEGELFNSALLNWLDVDSTLSNAKFLLGATNVIEFIEKLN